MRPDIAIVWMGKGGKEESWRELWEERAAELVTQLKWNILRTWDVGEVQNLVNPLHTRSLKAVWECLLQTQIQLTLFWGSERSNPANGTSMERFSQLQADDGCMLCFFPKMDNTLCLQPCPAVSLASSAISGWNKRITSGSLKAFHTSAGGE